MKTTKTKSNKKLKLKMLSGGKIVADQTDVGYIDYIIDRNVDKQFIIDCFDDDKTFVKKMKDKRFPKKFRLVWVNKLYVKQAKRGKGYGSKILDLLDKKFKKGITVIGLSPGDLVKTTEIDRLIPFYESNGFSIIKAGEHNYGFKIIRR